ncbi:MAG: histidine--tRNA ligase [Candidatus Berkelbacteria bacterium]
MSDKQLQKPRGTKDILPADQPAWSFFRTTAEKVLNGLSFSKIDTPLFEDKRIFERGVGAGTDIVEKEIYLIESVSGDDESQLALRPEGTAGAARAYIENGMSSQPQPVRLYYFGPMYRHERPQKGRYREHRQVGAEIFGDQSAESDYLAIMSAIEILKKLGFSGLNIAINSIGCPECRPKYLAKLKDYYADKLSGVCPDCKRRYDINPLRMLDCKNEECQKFKTKAPQMIDSLCTECREHFQDTLQYLDDFGIKFELDNTLVRGLDYYTRTVFEVSAGTDKERKTTLCGGGRYDNLVSVLGGPKTPAVGWGMGADRVVELLSDNGVKIPQPRGVEVVILEIGDTAKKVCRQIFDSFEKEDINVFYIPSKDSLRSQMKSASKLKADFALIVGQQEALTGSVIVRDLRTSTQDDLSVASAVEMIKEKYAQEND